MRTADGLTVYAAGEGDRFGAPFDLVRKATAAETGGWGVVVVTGFPGEGGRTHFHRGEAEAFFLLEGAVELLGAETSTLLAPGAFVLVPPNTEHGLRIVGDRPAAWLAIWPRSLDGYPDRYLQLVADGGSEAELNELAHHHGLIRGRSR